MAGQEDRRNLSTLPVELKVKLGFIEDPTNGWLYHDHFTNVGGAENYEFLPVRLRVSRYGTRYEVGAWKQDIEGLLELARILNPQVQDLDAIRSFWRGHKKFSVVEDADLLYIGVNLEPTPLAFEVEFGPTQTAYDLAITAAIKNMTYKELAAHKSHSGWLEYAIDPQQRSVLFNDLFADLAESAAKAAAKHEPEPVVTVDTLREFPLRMNKLGVMFVPGKLTEGEVSKELDDVFISLDYDSECGRPYIFIVDTEALFNSETKKWEHNHIRMKLYIPEGINISTVGDIAKLNHAVVERVKTEGGEEKEITKEYGVAVEVQDDLIRIKSKDGTFELEMRKPICEECGIPNWKFPYPGGEPEDNHSAQASIGNFYSLSTSLGVARFLVRTDERENEREKCVCANCIRPIVEKYLGEHPFVSKEKAIAVARRRLDEAGYEGVEILADQVWRSERLWAFFTALNYERDGRAIMRFTGKPTLSDNGAFKLNMYPHEYVNFRYQ